MLSPRWRKVLRDLAGNRSRTTLVVLSIAVGVFAVGMIAGTQVVLSRDLARDYNRVNPASATIYADPFDDDFVGTARRIKGVGEAQGRSSVSVRSRVDNGEWRNLRLLAVADYDDIRVNKIRPVSGAWPPPRRAVLIERNSLAFLGVNVGETIQVEMPDGRLHDLRVAGVLHDINQPPAIFANQGIGYVTFDTLERLGTPRSYNELQITVAENGLDKDHIQRVVEAVRSRVEKSGRAVYYVYVADPGKHPVDNAIQVFLSILGVLGFLALLLSGFLVVNTISALLAQQVRQIGVMKAVGAREGQVIGMYLVTVLAFGLMALVIGIPLGALGAYGFGGFLAAMINFDVQTFTPSPHVLGLQVLVGLTVPILAAAYPVVSGTRISVRQAWTDGYGKGGKPGWIDRLVGRIRFLHRPLLLSLRNTFRRKGRLALTLSTLTLGGAIFIGILSVRDSTAATLDEALKYFNYDVQVVFRQAHRMELVEQEMLAQPGVVRAESPKWVGAQRVRPNGAESNNFTVLALPAQTQMIQPTLIEGRWLLSDDENALVVNTILLKNEPDVEVGQRLVVKIDGRDTTWRVVGIVRGVMTGPIAYANRPYFEDAMRSVGRTHVLWVKTEEQDATSRGLFVKRLEDHFRSIGAPIRSVEAIADVRANVQAQFDLIVIFLMVMAVLLAVVGGLGLMGTMGLNVIERTREIGVMRAVGASDGAVRQVFVVEGILIGLLSWLVGAVLAAPLGQLLSLGVGMAFLQAPLTYRFSFGGTLLWLAIVVVVAALTSLLPARNASRLSVREVLAYE